ncbi:MAG: glycosyltransferase family 2 protein [Rhodocyclaceae bacterium]|nr:glycosyltransferase family 2 protein [Rhodocyclaceae bacterium]
MPRPTLSLLIPAYNAAPYLPRLLKSAHAQTQAFDEIWVYDDCSTDDTAEVAAAHGAKVLRGDVNKGCSAGKNALARHVKTDWIHFHDADDELLPNFVALAHKWIEQDHFDVVLFDYEYRDNETHELILTQRFDRAALEADAKRYSIGKQINPFCGLYRHALYEAIGGYDEDRKILYAEDSAFHRKLAFGNLTFSSEAEVSIINYRIGTSMSAKNRLNCAISNMESLKLCLQYEGAERYHSEIAAGLWNVAALLLSYDQNDEAIESAKLALRLDPESRPTGSVIFEKIAQFLPINSLLVREAGIRLLKPALRNKA